MASYSSSHVYPRGEVCRESNGFDDNQSPSIITITPQIENDRNPASLPQGRRHTKVHTYPPLVREGGPLLTLLPQPLSTKSSRSLIEYVDAHLATPASNAGAKLLAVHGIVRRCSWSPPTSPTSRPRSCPSWAGTTLNPRPEPIDAATAHGKSGRVPDGHSMCCRCGAGAGGDSGALVRIDGGNRDLHCLSGVYLG